MGWRLLCLSLSALLLTQFVLVSYRQLSATHGMKASLDVLTARDDGEALRLIRERGITHMVFLVSDYNPVAFCFMKYGSAGSEPALKEMFGTKLFLGQWPWWVQPIPFTSAIPQFRSNLRLYGVALFRIDPRALS